MAYVSQQKDSDGVDCLICETCDVVIWNERSDAQLDPKQVLAAHLRMFHANSRNTES
jgi:hypothetical protein